MDFLYLCNESGIVITKCISENEKIKIPYEIDGKPVIKIAEYAFSDNCFVKEITIEANLIEIGSFAFQFCEELVKINLPQSIRNIGESAFEGCVKLKEIVLPSVKKINKSLLEECSSLTYIEIPQSVELIDERAFEFCLNLQKLDMHEGVLEIRNGAFFCCRRVQYA